MKKNLNIYEVYNIKGERFLIDNIIKFLSSKKFKEINFKNLKNLKKENNIIYFTFSFNYLLFKKKLYFPLKQELKIIYLMKNGLKISLEK